MKPHHPLNLRIGAELQRYVFLVTLACYPCSALAQQADVPMAPAWASRVKPALAVVAYYGSGGSKVASIGTGFCIMSTKTTAYFVTDNHVVTDPPHGINDPGNGKVARRVFVILAIMPYRRLPAVVVRHIGKPDLAIVSVDVSKIPTLANMSVLRLSTKVLQETAPVAIGGFPYIDAAEWGQLFGSGDAVFPREKPDLRPSSHLGPAGPVRTIGGITYIAYDASTYGGNSGGPLFDPFTGEVYGIVIFSLPGAPPDKVYMAPVVQPYAVSTMSGLSFMNSAPITVTFAETNVRNSIAPAIERRYATRSLSAWERRSYVGYSSALSRETNFSLTATDLTGHL